jgi:lipopolysaccharide export LptBFGC system permease protein LptF
MLFDGTRQIKDQKTGNVSFFHFKTLSYDLDQLAANIQERIIKPHERSLKDLLTPPDADNISPTTKAQLRSEGHQRLVPPLLVLLFTLIGLCSLLPQELNRRGRQKKIAFAIGLAACIHIGLIFLINLNGRWPITIPLAYLSVIFIGVILLVILEKQNLQALWQEYTQNRNDLRATQ